MKENRVIGTNSKGEKEPHVLFESENSIEANIMSSSEFVHVLTEYLHCLDFSLTVVSKEK